MLRFLGLDSLERLFDAVPSSIRLKEGSLDLPDGLSEPDLISAMENYGSKNLNMSSDLVCFAGGGSYDHDIASSTRALSSRSEFMTAYTPYQPEVAQGILQALFEYQTMVSRLSGLPISNASLYDGASALVEAVNLAVAQKRNGSVWVSHGVNPSYREVLRTFAAGTGHIIEEIPTVAGRTQWNTDTVDNPGVIVVPYPSYLGSVEDPSAIVTFAKNNDIRLVFAYDPVSMALLRSPGQMGADVAVAEGQAFGVGLAFGGPYVGLFSTKEDYVRLLPGRLVGETLDIEGRTGYVTTLRTREQDIRREKASSNVCTNQTLIALTAAIQMSWLGKNGIKELANRCLSANMHLRNLIAEIPSVSFLSEDPILRDFAVKLPIEPETAVERMVEEGFLAGIPIRNGFEGSDAYGSLLVSATEKRTLAQLEAYADALRRVVR